MAASHQTTATVTDAVPVLCMYVYSLVTKLDYRGPHCSFLFYVFQKRQNISFIFVWAY